MPLLFTYDKNRFSHDVAHFQINRSYLCRIRRIEGKEFVASNFTVKKQLLIYHSGGHFDTIGTYVQPANQLVKIVITFERYKI